MDSVRKIIFYKHYFTSFYVEQTEAVRKKINQVLMLVKTQQQIPVKFFRQIESVKGLYEIRIESMSDIYRVFCCFDKGNLVVLFNGFQKKSQKTPKEQIERGEQLMKEYFNNQR